MTTQQTNSPAPRSWGWLPVALLVALLGLGACSGGGSEATKPAAQILTDAQAAAKTAASVHIIGGLNRGGAPATLELVLTNRGDGTEHISAAGRRIDITRIGPTVWVQGLPGTGPGYQRLPPQDPRAAQLGRELDKNTVFDQLVNSTDQASIVGADTVNGQPTVKLKPQTGPGTLDIATDPTHPYPLRINSSANNTITFTDWDQPITITPPPGS